MTVVRVELPPDSAGEPLSLADLGGAAGARKPLSAEAAEAGQFASVPYPHKVLDALTARGKTEVVWRGELETALAALRKPVRS